MPKIVSQILQRLGIIVEVSHEPLTEAEWERQRVLPIYEESKKGEGNELVDSQDIDAFLRGDLSLEGLEVKTLQ